MQQEYNYVDALKNVRFDNFCKIEGEIGSASQNRDSLFKGRLDRYVLFSKPCTAISEKF